MHCQLNAKVRRRINCFNFTTKLNNSTKEKITLYVQNEHYPIEEVAYSEQKMSSSIHRMQSGGFDVCESKSGVKVTGYN